MNKYIRLFDNHQQIEHPCWFRVIEHSDEVSAEDQMQANNSLYSLAESNLRKEIGSSDRSEHHAHMAIEKLKYLETKKDMGRLASHPAVRWVEKHPDTIALLRETGSWMTLGSDDTILETRFATQFPAKNEGAKVVICENDATPEPDWLAYMETRFDTPVRTLNLFRARRLDNLIDAFNAADVISFKTTFTSFDWWELLVEALGKCDNLADKTIVGYCYNQLEYERAFELMGLSLLHHLENVQFLTSDEYHEELSAYNIELT